MEEYTTETGDLFCTVDCFECPYFTKYGVCGPDIGYGAGLKGAAI